MRGRMSHSAICCTAAMLVAAALPAVEPELRIGPNEVVYDSEFLSQYVDEGAVRADATTWRNSIRGRYFDLGIEAEVYLLMEDDERRDVDAGEIVEAEIRLDYLLEIEGYAQVLPYLRYQYFPPFDDQVDEPLWLGVEGWYLLPVEGVEMGGSLAVDAAGEHGWYGDFGFRQIFQQAPLDLTAWQLLSFGGEDYHEFTSGADERGLGALRLGALLTLPLPWNGTWATLRTELSTWLDDDDRDVVEDDVEFVIGAGFEWRPGL
jgi:hypothetical protein